MTNIMYKTRRKNVRTSITGGNEQKKRRLAALQKSSLLPMLLILFTTILIIAFFIWFGNKQGPDFLMPINKRSVIL